MDKKHEVLSELKRLASELGKPPSRDYFRSNAKTTEQDFKLNFGTYTALLHAAGFNGKEIKKASPLYNSELFDLREHLEKHKDSGNPFKITKKSKVRRIYLGDIHFPFANFGAISLVYQMIEEIQPTEIVQLGDLNDCYSHAKFPRSHNVITPGEEAKLAREMGVKLWETIRKIAPRAECYQILGNHDIRPHKRIIETYPEGEVFMRFEDCYKFDGVTTHFDLRDPLKLGSTLVHHGHLSQIGAHMEQFKSNTVCGHLHRGGVVYKRYGDEIRWELNAGYLGDEQSKPMGYTPTKFTGWTLGLGNEDDFGPRFVAF